MIVLYALAFIGSFVAIYPIAFVACNVVGTLIEMVQRQSDYTDTEKDSTDTEKKLIIHISVVSVMAFILVLVACYWGFSGMLNTITGL